MGPLLPCGNPNPRRVITTDDQFYYTIRNRESLQRWVVASGVDFTNGYVSTPICGSARGSILTGKAPLVRERPPHGCR